MLVLKARGPRKAHNMPSACRSPAPALGATAPTLQVALWDPFSPAPSDDHLSEHRGAGELSPTLASGPSLTSPGRDGLHQSCAASKRKLHNLSKRQDQDSPPTFTDGRSWDTKDQDQLWKVQKLKWLSWWYWQKRPTVWIQIPIPPISNCVTLASP
jgi:hypothetical protein